MLESFVAVVVVVGSFGMERRESVVTNSFACFATVVFAGGASGYVVGGGAMFGWVRCDNVWSVGGGVG